MLSPLQPDEVDFIRAMGDHVGVDITLTQLRAKSIQQLEEEALAAGKVYMIPPDEKGCVFLQKMNGEHHCRIYRLRPRTCRGFRCTLPSSFFELFGRDSASAWTGELRHTVWQSPFIQRFATRSKGLTVGICSMLATGNSLFF